MDDTEKKAWKMTFGLWKDLSRNKYNTDYLGNCDAPLAERIKNHVLDKLNYPKCLSGCPFCEFFYRTEGCPLGDCSNSDGWDNYAPCFINYSYEKWDDSVDYFRGNDRFEALKFYHELIIVFIKRCMEE